MKSRTAVLSLVVAVMLTGSFVTASAFTSATVNRSAEIDVVADNTGLITLNDGATNVVTTKPNGELEIDMSKSGATGVNGNATFAFGTPSNVTGASSSSDIAAHDYAFTLGLGDAINGTSDSLQLSYTGPATNGDANVQFDVYTMSGQVASVSEESADTITNPDPSTTYYVVLTIDTGAGSTTAVLGSGDDLSGTLTIETV